MGNAAVLRMCGSFFRLRQRGGMILAFFLEQLLAIIDSILRLFLSFAVPFVTAVETSFVDCFSRPEAIDVAAQVFSQGIAIHLDELWIFDLIR